jgi:hypothetical protein
MSRNYKCRDDACILRTDYAAQLIQQTSDGKGDSSPHAEQSSALLSSIVCRKTEAPKPRYRRLIHELRAAGGYLEYEFPRQNVWIVAEQHFKSERQARECFREVKHRFGQQQIRDGYPRWHFEVLEAKCGVHSNIVGPLSLTRAHKLLAYSWEGVPINRGDKVYH